MKKKNPSFINMRVIQLLFCCILGLALLTACGKGGDGPTTGDGPHIINTSDTTAPVIDIFTPSEAQVFATGNPVSITGKVVDSGGLYRGSIRVVNDANGAVLKDQPYEIHAIISYPFNISYTPSVTTVSNYTVTVSFEDHGLNVASKSVKIKVNP